MSLTPKQLESRAGRLTASRVACLMDGDKDKILNLWRELVGDPLYVTENLDDVWPVQLGSVTEELNLRWYAKKFKVNLVGQGHVIQHSSGWAAATLDAWDPVRKCPVECKQVGGYEKLSTVIERYQPQMHWQMIVTDATECAISIIEGAREPVVEFIPYDKAYGDELWKRASEFMACVKSLRQPFELDPVAAPVKAITEYNYDTNNAWVSAAADWLETRIHHGRHEEAKDTLKELIPKDAKRVYGGKVEAVRDKANRIKIVEMKD